MKSHVCDVVVVGAGLAGLYAARRLAAAGVDVIVLKRRSGSAAGRGPSISTATRSSTTAASG